MKKLLPLLLLLAAPALSQPRADLVPKGATPAEVEAAIGKPDGRFLRRRAGHAEQTVWFYGTRVRGQSLTRGPEDVATPQGSPLFGQGKPVVPPPPASYTERFR